MANQTTNDILNAIKTVLEEANSSATVRLEVPNAANINETIPAIFIFLGDSTSVSEEADHLAMTRPLNIVVIDAVESFSESAKASLSDVYMAGIYDAIAASRTIHQQSIIMTLNQVRIQQLAGSDSTLVMSFSYIVEYQRDRVGP